MEEGGESSGQFVMLVFLRDFDLPPAHQEGAGTVGGRGRHGRAGAAIDTYRDCGDAVHDGVLSEQDDFAARFAFARHVTSPFVQAHDNRPAHAGARAPASSEPGGVVVLPGGGLLGGPLSLGALPPASAGFPGDEPPPPHPNPVHTSSDETTAQRGVIFMLSLLISSAC